MNTSRKRLFPLLVVVAVGCSAPKAPAPQAHYQPTSYADASDEIYALDNLVRFDLELAPESLQQLREQPREYAVGALRYRGQTLANVGVRLKGEASFRELDDKPAFKLKFDKFVKGQRFFGLKRMTLNNNVQDPSSLSQPLSYRVFRELGLPAPRCNSALVFVNGEYYGVYSNVETEDKVFLKRWFSSNDGNLYEENGIDLVAGAAALFNLETNEKQDNRSDLEALSCASCSG
jgi:spore coat protein CotH